MTLKILTTDEQKLESTKRAQLKLKYRNRAGRKLYYNDDININIKAKTKTIPKITYQTIHDTLKHVTGLES
jgi:hypothetical protein